MFKSFMEVKELKERIENLKSKLDNYEFLNRQINERMCQMEKEHKFDLQCADRSNVLAKEEVLNKLRKEMQEALINSDIARVKAETALETYKDMNTKDESKKVMEYLGKAIDGLSNQKVNVVK